MEKRYGLLGRKLGHSWSEPIHKALGCRDYRNFELEPEELEGFLRRKDLGGLNVTMPYKRDVMRYCDVIDPAAGGDFPEGKEGRHPGQRRGLSHRPGGGAAGGGPGDRGGLPLRGGEL